jgi:hypothetical protein
MTTDGDERMWVDRESPVQEWGATEPMSAIRTPEKHFTLLLLTVIHLLLRVKESPNNSY